MAAPRKIKAIVHTVKRYSDGVTAFTFKPQSRCRFRSGQFLHLAIEPYDPSFNWPESRVFSIANSPDKSELIEILVAPKGDFTWNMVQKLSEGQEIWLKMPYGDFNYNLAVGKDVVLIAGGTGISPFIPFLEEYVYAQGQYKSVHLYYGIRKMELIIFEELFAKLLNTISGFRLNLSIEEEQDGAIFNNKIGIIDLKGIFSNKDLFGTPIYYISGPKAMIDSALAEAEKYDISNASIFYDKWE